MEIEFRCTDCSAVNETEESPIVCRACSKNYDDISEFAESGVPYCIICRCRDLYTQKDFNRKIGLAIVIAGAVLAPFTRLISLFVCALIDLFLYLLLPTITVCYKCHAIYRGFPRNPNHEGFNLGINDRYRASERG